MGILDYGETIRVDITYRFRHFAVFTFSCPDFIKYGIPLDFAWEISQTLFETRETDTKHLPNYVFKMEVILYF